MATSSLHIHDKIAYVIGHLRGRRGGSVFVI
jgi:hypothetical protein